MTGSFALVLAHYGVKKPISLSRPTGVVCARNQRPLDAVCTQIAKLFDDTIPSRGHSPPTNTLCTSPTCR